MSHRLVYLLVLLFIAGSCTKPTVPPPTEDNQHDAILNQQLPANAELLKEFLSGEMTIKNKGKTKIVEFQVKNYEGMLHFPTSEDARNFIYAKDYIIDHWDYTGSEKYYDTKEEVNHLGDQALNAIDDLLGFHSLRYYYLKQEFEFGIDYEKELEFYVGDPDLQALSNQFAEIRIGENIYKLLKGGDIAVVYNLDQEVLQSLREKGPDFRHNNLGRMDRDSMTGRDVAVGGHYIGGGSSTGGGTGRGLSCQLQVTEGISERNVDGDYRRIRYSLQAISAVYEGESFKNNCLFSHEVTDWGDGFSEGFGAGDTKPHTYNVNLNQGETKNFTLSYRISNALTPPNCSACKATETGTRNIVIARPIDDCNTSNQERSPTWSGFTYGGESYSIKCENGQRTNWNLFLGTRKIWARTTFYKWINNKYRRRKPPVAIEAVVKGKYVSNLCTTLSVPFVETERGKKESVCAKFNPGEAFGTIDDMTHPDRVLTNHKAEMGGSPSFTHQMADWPLFP